jgi:hypothetical protein
LASDCSNCLIISLSFASNWFRLFSSTISSFFSLWHFMVSLSESPFEISVPIGDGWNPSQRWGDWFFWRGLISQNSRIAFLGAAPSKGTILDTYMQTDRSIR